MPQNFLSRFTPSLMAPEVLEEIFVQREALAARLVRQVRESVLGSEKHQRLIVGPRGIGKTHLVSLVYHRLRAVEDLRDRMRVAWLREEEWGVSSFLDLLVRILAALAGEDPDAGLRERLAAIYSLDGDDAEVAALSLLSEVLGGRTLVLILENLDEVFAGLGERGQQRFRAYLQNRRECAILATSQALFGAVWLEASPFFGFFQVTHLKEFDVEAARTLLLNLARYMGNGDLATLLATTVGRSRLEALHHLVGGNPRLYVILAQFLTRESLDDLVDAFFKALDELTPYYRERMKSLAPLQQKLVYLLSEAGAPVSVKVLAERAFSTQQTVSSQLKQLRAQRFVVAHAVGRESWYELREPLLRLVLRVKKERGAPVRLFVDFLRVWYSRVELAERLSTLPPLSTEASYLQHALSLADPGESDAVRALIEAFNQAYGAAEWEQALELNDRLRDLREDDVDWIARGRILAELGRLDEALKVLDEAAERAPGNAVVVVTRALILAESGNAEEASATLERVAAVDDPSGELLLIRAPAWLSVRRADRALHDYQTLVRFDPENPAAHAGIGLALVQLGRASEAMEMLEPFTNVFGEDPKFVATYGLAATAVGRFDEAEAAYIRLTQAAPKELMGWIGLAQVRYERGQYLRAMEALDRLEMIPTRKTRGVFALRGLILTDLRRFEEALESFDRADEHPSPWVDANALQIAAITTLAWLGRWPEVLQRFTRALKELEPRSEPRLRLVGAAVLALARQKEPFWGEGVSELLARIDDDTDRLVLGTTVISAVELLLRTTGTAAARRWLDAWAEASRQFVEIHVGHRLADVAVRYREHPDERLLLGLPQEERKVVTILLDIPKLEAESA